MFNNDYALKQLAEDHVQDMYREVKANRLARDARRNNPKQSPVLRLLHWLKQDEQVEADRIEVKLPARPVTGPLATETWH